MRNLILQTGSGAVAQLTEWLTNPTSAEGRPSTLCSRY